MLADALDQLLGVVVTSICSLLVWVTQVAILALWPTVLEAHISRVSPTKSAGLRAEILVEDRVTGAGWSTLD